MLRDALRLVRNYAEPKAVVLMYHRVAELESDAWDLAVAPENFEQHLRILKQTGNVISANELVERLGKHTLKRRSLVITFDDGYRDNYLAAKPLLERYELPATFFVATENIGQEKEFWWDELESIFLLSERLPALFSLIINGHRVEVDLSNKQQLSKDLRPQHWRWKAVEEAPPNLRAALFYQVWQLLKALPYVEQQLVIQQIREWAGLPSPVRADYRTMSADQLRELSRNPIFTLGAHTVTHPALTAHPTAFQTEELSASKQVLCQTTSTDVNLVSYPYGEYNDETTAIASDLGFQAAFTTEAKAVTGKTQQYRMGRFQVNNWDGNEFRRRLNCWLSYS